MKAIAIVPARSGSKGVKDKNIRVIEGKTLLEWAIEVGVRSKSISKVYISTDSPVYEKIALQAGACSLGLRSPELARDDTRTIDVVLDLLCKLPKCYDVIVLLQPTSPVRSPRDIDNAIRLLDRKEVQGVVSLVKLDEPHPYKCKQIVDGWVRSFIPDTSSEVPRQLLPPVYIPDGAIYAVKTPALFQQRTLLPVNTVPYIRESEFWVNINTDRDLLFLEYLTQRGKLSLRKKICGESA